MLRTVILIAVFLFSLSLITLAYSQSSSIQDTLDIPVAGDTTSACPVGNQIPPSEQVANLPHLETGLDKCGQYGAYIQGVCGCDPKTGLLKRGNTVCEDALKNLKPGE